MNLDRELILGFLEEDNIQRAYFRVRPLLTPAGEAQQEADKRWPDNGCLRIVPDKNELHTFKDRMRSLGSYCLLNLRGVAPEANKIRTNKNYRPERGETNQFILYSDIVSPLPERIFYEVLAGSAADFAALASRAITPLYYIQEGDTLYGPVRRNAQEAPKPAAEATGVLYTVTCPDETTHQILCIPEEAPDVSAEPAPAPRKEEAPLPLGRPLEILDQSKSFDETLHTLEQPLSKGANLLHGSRENAPAEALDAPRPASNGSLSGTPLFRAPLKTSVRPPKNRVQEVVASQWMVGRYEPPAAPLPAGATMSHVENPVENACRSLKEAWRVPEAQEQLMNQILALDGMCARLVPHLAESAGGTALQKVLQSRLADVEAERLSALIQLDRAKEDLEAFRTAAINSATKEARKSLDELTVEQERCKSSVAALRKELEALTAQRDALTSRIDVLQHDELPATLAKALADAQMVAPMADFPLRIACRSGALFESDEMIARAQAALSRCGASCERNDVIALLTLLAVSPRIGVTTQTPAPVFTAARNLAGALGWQGGLAQQLSPDQRPVLSPRPADATPAILMTALGGAALLPGVSRVMVARDSAILTRTAAYEAEPWPILPLPRMDFVTEPTAGESVVPVSAASLARLLDHACATDEEIDLVLQPLYALVTPLSGKAAIELHRFVAVCAGLMTGGLAAAIDWAILLWLLPAMDRSAKTQAALLPLLEEYPLSLEHATN